MRSVLFILACFCFVAMFSPKTADAGWGLRGGCSACQAGSCQAEAPVVAEPPMQSVCTSGCHPLAKIAKGAAVATKAVVVGTARVVTGNGPIVSGVRSRVQARRAARGCGCGG